MKKARQWAAVSMILAGNALAACNVASPELDNSHKQQFETHAKQAVEHIDNGEFLAGGEDFVRAAQDCGGAIDPREIGEVCAALEVIKKYSGAMLANNANNPQNWQAFIPRDNTNFVKLIEAVKHYNSLLRGVDHDIRHRLYEPVRPDVELVILGVGKMIEYRKSRPVSEPQGLGQRAAAALLRNHDPVADLEERREQLVRAHQHATR